MKNWEDTLISPETPIGEAVRILDEASLQICLVVDEGWRLLGTLTDGDVRRALLRGHTFGDAVQLVMNACPLTANPEENRESLLQTMTELGVHHIPLLANDRRVVGLVKIDNLLGHEKEMENWVVLMAGGLGLRLRPLTEATPKPMLEIGKKPILETIIENFVAHGFTRFYISVNYLADVVKNYFGTGQRWNAEIRYLHEESPLGTAGALQFIDPGMTAPLIVMNADVLTKVNFRRLLWHHRNQKCDATLAVREYDIQVPFGVVHLDDDKLKGIVEKPLHKVFVNAGIYVLEPSVLDLVPRDGPYDMPQLINELVAQGRSVAAFPVREYWLDIGRAGDFQTACRDFHKEFRSS